MKHLKILVATAVTALSLSAFAQIPPFGNATPNDRGSYFVQLDEGETTSEALTRFASSTEEQTLKVTQDQAVSLAQRALVTSDTPDSVTLALMPDEGSQYKVVWDVVIGEFQARVDAGTGYAYTGYVSND